jgi:hypothetical protein
MTTFSSDGYALANGDGQHIWFLGTLMSIKAGARADPWWLHPARTGVAPLNLRRPRTSMMTRAAFPGRLDAVGKLRKPGVTQFGQGRID